MHTHHIHTTVPARQKENIIWKMHSPNIQYIDAHRHRYNIQHTWNRCTQAENERRALHNSKQYTYTHAQTESERQWSRDGTHTCVHNTRIQMKLNWMETRKRVCPISVENRGRCSVKMYAMAKGNERKQENALVCRMVRARSEKNNIVWHGMARHCDRHRHVRNGNYIGILLCMIWCVSVDIYVCVFIHIIVCTFRIQTHMRMRASETHSLHPINLQYEV